MEIIYKLWSILKFFLLVCLLATICYAVISFASYRNSKVSAWSTTPPACEWSGESFPDGNWRQAVQDDYDETEASPYGSLSGNVRPATVWTSANFVIGRTAGFDNNDNQNIQIHIKSAETTLGDSSSGLYIGEYDGEHVFKALNSGGSNGNGVIMVVNSETETVTDTGATWSNTGSFVDGDYRAYAHSEGNPEFECIYEVNIAGYIDGVLPGEFEEYNPAEPWETKECSSIDFVCWFQDFLGGVAQSQKDFFEGLIGFFQNLFIPNPDLMEGIFEELATAINNQLGLLLYPFEFIADILSQVNACNNFFGGGVCGQFGSGLIGGEFMGQDWDFVIVGEDQSAFGTSPNGLAFADWITNLVRIIIVGLLITGYHGLFVRVFRT